MKRGDRIQNRREELGISQAELARMLNKTRSLISHIEKTGKVNDLTYYDILQKLDLAPQTEEEHYLVKRFEHIDKPSDLIKNMSNELEYMRRENVTLREMIELQKAVIEMLRKGKA